MILLYILFFGSDILISTCLVIPVWVINCVLLFNSPSSVPTAFGFCFLFSSLFLSFRFAWHFSCELRPFWPTLHLWWVFFVLFYFSFCFVLQIVVLREYWVFSLFSLKSQPLFYQSEICDTGQENYFTVYFCHWYLFIGHLYDYFFVSLLLSCGGYKGFKEEERAVITIVIVS